MHFSFPVVWNNVASLYLIGGAWTTLWLTLVAMAAGLAFGLVAALGRLSRWRIPKAAAAFYIWLFRGTPLLVQLVMWYTGLPEIGIHLSGIMAAVIGLGLNEGAYMAEIIRAGILSVDHGQMEAAKALGMTSGLAMQRIIIPQAIRVIIPPTGNEFIGMLKNTSLVSVIAVSELLLRTENLISTTFRTLELLTVASIYYLFLTSLLTLMQRRVERWSQQGFVQTSSVPAETRTSH